MTKDLKAAFEEYFANHPLPVVGVLPEGTGYTEEALQWCYQAGAKHILELVKSEGIGKVMVEAMKSSLWDDTLVSGDIEIAASDTQKAIADEIQKRM